MALGGLRITLGGRDVLRDVSLELASGNTIALLGASGSGKSTLLRTAVGLLKPDDGSVRLFGEDILSASSSRLRELRRRVGMLFQQNALFDSMTVEENVGFALKEVLSLPPARIKEKVDDLLERLNLGPIGGKYPRELSGGMKKRVGIARAIAHGPSLVFLDDPTAGLDPITSDVIADLIAEKVKEKDRSAVVVSNHLPLVMKVAQEAALLYKGRLIELGPPRDIEKSDRKELRQFLEMA